MICLKPFSSHYEVAAEIFACKLDTLEMTDNCVNATRYITLTRNVMTHSAKLEYALCPHKKTYLNC